MREEEIEVAFKKRVDPFPEQEQQGHQTPTCFVRGGVFEEKEQRGEGIEEGASVVQIQIQIGVKVSLSVSV